MRQNFSCLDGYPVTYTKTVAERYLSTLKSRGVDVLYVGAGTDTAPIVEAYANESIDPADFPLPVVAVHENLAVGMAHGYYMVTGKPQAVMLHVAVGAANAICGLMNAKRARVPMFFTAGRTPLYETGHLGARTSEIHWGQEMYDQGGMARELVKWDYELRDACHVDQLVDRGLNIAMAHPRGPVYLTLPREVLCQTWRGHDQETIPATPSSPWPSQTAVELIARKLAEAEFPVIVASMNGDDPATVSMLAELCNQYAIGIAEDRMARYLNAPADHPFHLGFGGTDALKQADVLLFLESDVPWVPSRGSPRPGAFIAHAGVDPVFSDYPVRSFHSDVSVTTEIRHLLPALHAELKAIGADSKADKRRQRLASRAAERRKAVQARIDQDEAQGGPITKLFLSRCLDQVRDDDTIFINEYPLVHEVMNCTQPGSLFTLPSSGGLGWAVPAALGAKQAKPEKTVIAVVGDGAYIFANPAACHQAAEMHDLPIVIVIYNNQGWEAVESATLTVYPDQNTAKFKRTHGTSPLSSLKPLPAFEQYCTASNGHGERVEKREDLLPALQRAIAISKTEKRVSLLNVMGA